MHRAIDALPMVEVGLLGRQDSYGVATADDGATMRAIAERALGPPPG